MSKKQNFKINDKVWAKMKGYPPWPGKIICAKKRCFYIFFYGTENYGWIQAKYLYPYIEFEEQFSKNIKSLALKKAVLDANKFLIENKSCSDKSDDDHIPLSQIGFSSSNENVPLINLIMNNTISSNKCGKKSKSQNTDEMRYVSINGIRKLARIKHTKGSSHDSEDYINIISVSINDEAGINKLIPKKLKVIVDPCELVT